MKKIIYYTFVVLLSTSSLIIYAQSSAGNRPIHEVHSMMLYNFTKYIQWPDNASGTFTIAVMGDDDVFNTLKSWYTGKTVSNRKLTVVKCAGLSDLKTCDILYVSRSKSKDFESIHNKFADESTLIITDKQGLGKKGSDINFKLVNNRLAFELNMASINKSNLKVSKQLMNIAILI